MTRLVLLERDGDAPLIRLLKTLGVEFERCSSIDEALPVPGLAAGDEVALILSAEHLSAARAFARARSLTLAEFFSNFGQVLVFPWDPQADGADALSELIGGKVSVVPLQKADSCYSVKRSEIAGPFSGLVFGPANPVSDFGMTINDPSCPVETIVSIGQFGFFTRIDLPTTQLFVCCAGAVFEVSAEVRRNLRAAVRFSGLVPLIFFLRHCAIDFWQTPVRTASVVIDDPHLKATYGFLEAKTLARCVDDLGCAVSIGFIPWNYNRTSPAVVELFRARRHSLSLCVHGCDHMRDEFCAEKVSTSQQLVALALERMQRLSQRTGLSYDKVMVFPRGEFSGSAMRALRESSLLAGVNTELIDTQSGQGVKAAELLQPAITAYSGFPLFLRRPASEPIANFALDLLLGKPCLVGMHHDYFRSGPEQFISLVNSLNALDPTLTWTNLASIVSRTCSIRSTPTLGPEMRLLSPCTSFAAQESLAEVRFSKREPLLEKSFRTSVDGQETASTRQNGEICFAGKLSPGAATLIKVEISPCEQVPVPCFSLPYRVKVAARRHLSRIRDDHFSRSAWANALFHAAQGRKTKDHSSCEDLPQEGPDQHRR